MRHVISPWGYVVAEPNVCDKCGTPMHDDHDRRLGITIYACFKCGNRLYLGYPRHRGDRDVPCSAVEGLAA